LSKLALQGGPHEAERQAAKVLSKPVTHQPEAMEARMRSRHIIAVAALLIFSFGVIVFFFSNPIADAALQTGSVGQHTKVSPIGEPPYP
jgi:hypothetical protein